jgi:hypothetical protein
MKLSEYCNIKSDGVKAVAVNQVMEMLQKAASGDFEIDDSIKLHNHLKPASWFFVATTIVDCGIVNHNFLKESYDNLIVKGVPPTPMGTATYDNKAGNNSKKCAPSREAWDREFAKGRSPTYSIPLGKKLAETYTIQLHNPYKDAVEGELSISREEVIHLNPQWEETVDRPATMAIHIGVSRSTKEITKHNKYCPYINFEYTI